MENVKSVYDDLDEVMPIEIFLLIREFHSDPVKEKVFFVVGTYRDENDKPWVLPVVRKVEDLLIKDKTSNHEYVSSLGNNLFTERATKFLLGKDSEAIKEGRAFGVQSVGDTGALRIVAEFLRVFMKYDTIYISTPCWINHDLIFSNAGYENIKRYRYWDSAIAGVDFKGMLEDLENAKERSIVLLDVCAHNPTGCDLTQEQWKILAEVIKRKKLFPLFDTAYQGFVSGDPDKDAWPVRYFAEEGFELICGQSFSKNFGLYDERIGNLTFIINNPKHKTKISFTLVDIIRAMYLNPSNYGSKIVSTILGDEKLYNEWLQNLNVMTTRMSETRKKFRQKLEDISTPGNWENITNQVGMFSLLNFTEKQVKYLKTKHHIYLLSSGRANICGINDSNIDYVARAFKDTMINCADY